MTYISQTLPPPARFKAYLLTKRSTHCPGGKKFTYCAIWDYFKWESKKPPIPENLGSGTVFAFQNSSLKYSVMASGVSRLFLSRDLQEAGTML